MAEIPLPVGQHGVIVLRLKPGRIQRRRLAIRVHGRRQIPVLLEFLRRRETPGPPPSGRPPWAWAAKDTNNAGTSAARAAPSSPARRAGGGLGAGAGLSNASGVTPLWR